MIEINGTAYRLALLDTNMLSEIAKHDEMLPNYWAWAMSTSPAYVPCFSPFSVLELRRQPDVYRRFVERFDTEIPCFMLKGYEELLEAETRTYPDPSRLDPTSLAFSPLGADGNRLAPVFDNPPAIKILEERERAWHSVAEEIIEGIVSLVPNYPPKGATYTTDEVRFFVFLTGLSQIGMRQHAFMKRSLGRGQTLEIDAFPSVKAMTYSVFHRFYDDRGRRSAPPSDTFDLLISAATPYVDAVITEKFQAEVLRKTKLRDGFIDHVEVFRITDFRASPPLG